MSTWSAGRRPITLAILAMGGEGGGVLSDWIVGLADHAGWYAQNTSVAGVAQRTGATVYYAELYPPDDSPRGPDARTQPVLGMFPTPGEVDVVIASELMECGRAVQRGFSTPDRTTLITSTNRVYSVDERSALGDGRVDSGELLAAAERGSQKLVAADFMAIAEQARSVISASLFGALAGSGALPFGREDFEHQIRAAGKGVEQSLAAFAAGFEVASATVQPPHRHAAPEPASSKPVTVTIGPRPRSAEEVKADEDARRNAIAATDPASLLGPGLRGLAAEVLAFPAASRSMVLHGLVRTAVYQDLDYAQLYLTRVRELAELDPDRDGAARLSVETARHVAIWMCYQDTIHVALQKLRARRVERIRAEAGAGRADVVQVREFLHPQIDEITDTMPSRLGARLRRSKSFQKVVHRLTREGMVLNSSSIKGATMLSITARLRPLRPRSLRFVREQDAIGQWLALARLAARADADLAREVIECQRVLKGYGATYEHGTAGFTKLLAVGGELIGQTGAAVRLAELRTAALADEDGTALEAALAN